jgi:hypothetical protein
LRGRSYSEMDIERVTEPLGHPINGIFTASD